MKKFKFMLIPGVLMMAPLAIQAQTGRTVTLTWTASTSPNVTGNNVYRAPLNCATATPTQFGKVNGTPITASNYDDISMPAYGDYCYFVRAVSGAFESPDSNKAEAAVRPKAPTGLNGLLALTILDDNGMVLAHVELPRFRIPIDLENVLNARVR